MMTILPFLVALLAAWPAAAQLRCVILSPDSATVIAGPMPASEANDCSQYANAVPITTGDSRWAAWLKSQSAIAEIQAHAFTRAQKLAAGIAITCTCLDYRYGSLNGTYPLTEIFVSTLNGLAVRTITNRSLTGDGTVELHDMTGTAHSWDAPHLLALADAVTVYRLSLQSDQASNWPPSNAVTIK